jgi:hypothetical protein
MLFAEPRRRIIHHLLAVHTPTSFTTGWREEDRCLVMAVATTPVVLLQALSVGLPRERHMLVGVIRDLTSVLVMHGSMEVEA